MSNLIVVKTSLNDDIRRFSVKDDCTWSDFKLLMHKLYEVDVSTYRITYKDEEGDDLSITTDEELQEGLRLANQMKPAILRVTLKLPNPLLLSTSETEKVSTNLSSSIPIVYVSGRAFVPSTVVKPKQYGPKKCSSEEVWPLKPQPVSTSLLDTKKDILTPQTSSSPLVFYPFEYVETDPESYPITSSAIIKSTSPLVVVINPDSKKQTLAELTASIAESISKLVLESSDSVLRNSAAVSASVTRDTQAIANTTADSNLEVSALISRQTQTISSNSVAPEHDDTILYLANISRDTSQVSSSASSSTSASVNQNSTAILDSVFPISQHTIGIQKAATVGLQDDLNKGIDDVVRSIMMATTPSSSPNQKYL